MKRRTDHLFSLRGGLLLLGWFVFAACLCGCGGEAQLPAWEDFCAEMEQNFSENPDVLTPNYIDLDDWCYFLAEDSRQIYRFSQADPQPEAIIQNAWGCMTVMEEGVLFMRCIPTAHWWWRMVGSIPLEKWCAFFRNSKQPALLGWLRFPAERSFTE